MKSLAGLYHKLTSPLGKLDPLLPLLARFVFAAVLFRYFWVSAKTKLGDGLLGFLFPSDGAYVQIFPRAMEAAGYDSSQLGLFHWLVALAGTWAEFILPVLIVLGLLSRFAALAMIGFVLVQSATDYVAHQVALGTWFDKAPDGVLADARTLWIFVLLVIAIKGGGALSLDRFLCKKWAK